MSLAIMHTANCPLCGSEDYWLAEERREIQGLKITVRRSYCNPCGQQDWAVFVDGRQVHSHPEGGTVVLKEGCGEATKR